MKYNHAVLDRLALWVGLILSLMLLFMVGGCKVLELEDPDSLTVEDVIEISAASEQVNANGVDGVSITATLMGDTPDGQNIVFRTDTGTFSGSNSSNPQEINLNAAGRKAEVFLISSTDVKEKVTVSASVSDYTDSTSIRFVRVFPVRIYLTGNVTQLPADGQNTAVLTAILVPPEDKGAVSKGARVIFEAVDANTGAAVAHLYREALSIVSGGQGMASVNMTSQQPGLMQITCRVEDAPNVTATYLLEFVD